MVLADSRKISRVPRYLGAATGSSRSFVYRTLTFSGPTFQNGSTRARVCNFRPALCRRNARSRNPDDATHTGLTRHRFRLIPVRSPLLGESQLLSFPGATEMFQLAPLAISGYGFTGH
jgi:hypothetical protein